jgi:small subunit ribosomal protein S16
MVKIRLTMFGRLKDPFYRIVVASERSKREGKPLEVLGFWNPKSKKLELDREKMKAWIAKGAQLTIGVKKLLEIK